MEAENDYINRSNADYIEQMYRRYQTEPRSVDVRWQAFFQGFEAASGHLAAMANTVVGEDGEVVAAPARTELPEEGPELAPLPEIAELVHSFRELGHFVADLDPLGHARPPMPLLDLEQFGLSDEDLDQHVGTGGFRGETDGTLRDLVARLRTTYCGHVGVEFMAISDKAQREWLQQRMETTLNHPDPSAAESKALLYELAAAQGFEEFLGIKYATAKRFSLEGGESLIPLLNRLIEDGATLGVEEVVMGAAHRGRLNILAHVLNKPYDVIISEFEGKNDDTAGDVKYHLGYSQDRMVAGRKIHISLSFNPSHLELVDPVVEGIVCAKQHYKGDHAVRTRVVPILVHGDASFTGQGIVLETLGLSELPYYRSGGTIHIIINNQIGFTTWPRQGRFTPYPTDVAKMIQAPIFHVNGDDPEACVHAAKLAMAFRQEFHQDVFIDLWCYRRHGHNEVDDPSYTQPLMTKEIAAHPRVRETYGQLLEALGKLEAGELDKMKTEARSRMDRALVAAKEGRPRVPATGFAGAWAGMQRAGNDWTAKTSVPAEILRIVGESATRLPADFTPHPKIPALLAKRLDMAAGKVNADWGCAEMLALGTLLLEGTPIRLSGQDSQRGTFSHRHACLRDYNTDAKYVPLANLAERQAPIILVNTMLSELAVLGFEYGFSSADPRNLVIWEAQFGDFINGAQPIIDQFIVCAEAKWQKYCGLVMLLPHGYEGAGPEHSSAWMERFLAQCAENNIQVCYPSLPAQYFHLLRRQMLRKFRKPLVILTPKSLLRDERSSSPLREFTEETFRTVIDDPANPQRVRRLLLCTGKIYFTLDEARRKENVQDVALVRVEQLYPFPQKELQQILAKYAVQEVCWVQEEPKNRGAWTFMSARLQPMLAETTVLTYCGREESASTATGSMRRHLAEEREILKQALELSAKPKEAAGEAPVPAAAQVPAAAAAPAQAAQPPAPKAAD